MLVKKIAAYANIALYWRLLGSPRAPYAPEQISIEVTNACNFKCVFCAQSDPEHLQRNPLGFMTPERLDKILSKLRRGGIQQTTLSWTLDGEPFLNKQFPDLCAIAIQHGFKHFVFATNFVAADLATLKRLPRNAEYICAVDYCANVDLFESVRGIKGSWQTIRENILALHDAQLDHIRIGLTDITSYVEKDPKRLAQSRAELQSLFRFCGHVKVVGSRDYHNQAGFVPTLTSSSKSHYRRCAYPWYYLVIAQNGDVVPCCRDTRKSSILGNILEQELEDIWNGDKMQAMRNNLVTRDVALNAACKHCDLPWGSSKFNLSFLIHSALKRFHFGRG